MKNISILSLAIAIAAVGCGSAGSGGVDPNGGEATSAASSDALTSSSELLGIARHLDWADKGELNETWGVGTNGSLTRRDIDRNGSAGFHGYRTTWGADAIPTYDVVASFAPVLILKVKDCSGCTSITVGRRRSDGKFEIKNAAPKQASVEGPVLGDSYYSHHEVFLTSLDNLRASADPNRVAKAVTSGTYNIMLDNQE